MTFSDVAFVWCGNSWSELKSAPGIRPVCSVAVWPMVLRCKVIGWDGAKPDTIPAAELRKYRVFLVNLFTDSRHVTQIRSAHPRAYIIAMPDPYLELVLYDDSQLILEQMAEADAIGGRTRHDAATYGALLDKPAFWLPSPIGPPGVWDAFWATPKEDAIIATEHNGYPRSAAATIAALASLQRRLDVPVHFYRPTDKTRRLAELAGLQATWHEATDYPRMVEATARARWGIDLYDGHSQGRNMLTHAMAGTPAVGSVTNNPAGMFAVEPYRPDEAVRHVMANWKGERYQRHRQRGREFVEATYGFEASRRRMKEVLYG